MDFKKKFVYINLFVGACRIGESTMPKIQITSVYA